ncbi:hypothetical protein [Conchiformibius steedae]|uniref:Uncharacterized protein n=1 Tax=Conchiformibius steedae TaxID=153493 RepID=A0A3P2A6J3_9NEIS|nr:hypothetical protein [Conchiformibius steedae]RRD90605.1 hypothetical protein EII21_04845 [Conchiformibius steedae]
MKKIAGIFVGCFCLICLVSCDQSNQKSRDLRNVSRDELIQFYKDLPDNKVRDIYTQQIKSECVREFQYNAAQVDANRICTCIANKAVDNFSISNLRKMLLPEHMLNQNEMKEISNLVGSKISVMTEAVKQCQ